MTAFSPYQPYPGPAPVLVAPPPVLVAVSDPAPQRRATVAFRLILAVPHLFVLYWIFLAGGIVAFIGWWGALFTGRMPQFAVTFLSGLVRWSIRVYAYDYLLTDVYPPFTFEDDPTYPVRVAIPAPQRLNRAAVLFRYFLALPVGILGSIVIAGASTLMAFIAWLITLVAGQLPPSFYLAYVAVIRFHARYYAYWWMLTPAYPSGLYGDRPGTVAWADQLPAAQPPGFGTAESAYGISGSAWGNPVDSAPQGYGAPSQGYGTPQGYGQGYVAPAPGYGGPVGYGAPGGYGARPVFQPTTWLLRLTSGARNLVTVFIALGAVFMVAYVAFYVAFISRTANDASTTATAFVALSQLGRSHATLSDGLITWEQATTNCDRNLTCVTKQDSNAAKAFTTFSSQLAATSVPANATAAKAKLSATTATVANDLTQLSETTTASQYESTITSTGLQQNLDSFDADYNALTKNLEKPF